MIFAALLAIASTEAPPGVPVWAWALVGVIATYAVKAVVEGGKAIWGASRWVAAHEKPEKRDSSESLRLQIAALQQQVNTLQAAFASHTRTEDQDRVEIKAAIGDVKGLVQSIVIALARYEERHNALAARVDDDRASQRSGRYEPVTLDPPRST